MPHLQGILRRGSFDGSPGGEAAAADGGGAALDLEWEERGERERVGVVSASQVVAGGRKAGRKEPSHFLARNGEGKDRSRERRERSLLIFSFSFSCSLPEEFGSSRTSERRRPDALGKAARVTAEAEAREAIVRCGAMSRIWLRARRSTLPMEDAGEYCHKIDKKRPSLHFSVASANSASIHDIFIINSQPQPSDRFITPPANSPHPRFLLT